jgi:hypothetical protein
MRVPPLLHGATRPWSAASLLSMSVRFEQERAATDGAELDAAWGVPSLVDAAVRAAAELLDDLPDLPLIGEPFGGEEGTD